ncbi:MAG: hypothetical protein PF588_02070 [Candidatus Kapabacteria bacterium]|jgi:hypothetical protein|nr:hypothetical protein [Candidatus Kapabacteria bacterium]
MEKKGKKIVIPEDELVKNYTPEIRTLKKRLLAELGQMWNDKDYAKISEYGLAEAQRLPQQARGDGDKEISAVHFVIGSAMKELNYDKEHIKYHALQAAYFDRKNKNAMWLLRDIRNEYSEDSKYFLIEVKGTLYVIKDTEEKEELFFAVYAVVADNQDEALSIIKEFERPEVRNSLEIFTAQIAEPSTNLPKGIYKTSALIANAELEKEENHTKN